MTQGRQRFSRDLFLVDDYNAEETTEEVKLKALKVAAIYGASGAGKSNLIKKRK